MALPPCFVLETQSGGGGHHRAAAAVDGGDDLLSVDALQVDGGGAEVGVAELALDDVQGHAFVGELDRVGVAQLVRRKSPGGLRRGSRGGEARSAHWNRTSRGRGW